MNECNLLDRAKQGEPSAFEALVRPHQNRLLKLALCAVQEPRRCRGYFAGYFDQGVHVTAVIQKRVRLLDVVDPHTHKCDSQQTSQRREATPSFEDDADVSIWQER